MLPFPVAVWSGLVWSGHETTASTLTWAFLLIDRHPEVGRKLHEEAVDVLGGAPPDLAGLHRLTYTNQVIEEVMWTATGPAPSRC